MDTNEKWICIGLSNGLVPRKRQASIYVKDN